MAELWVDVSYAARRPWVPRRAQFQTWAGAALAHVTGLEDAPEAGDRRPPVRSPGGGPADGPGHPATKARIVRALRPTQSARAAGSMPPYALSVRVVGVARSQSLNAAYRHKHKPTNVLSFGGAGLAPDGRHYLGELVICAPVVAHEARSGGKSAAAHWAHMTIHGVLHLLGFDHERDREARRMAAREVEALESLGFSDPYV